MTIDSWEPLAARVIRVVVVDDAAVVRRVVTRALDDRPGIEVVGAAPDGLQALAMIRSLDPDVVVLDLEMPVMDGFDVLRSMSREGMRASVVVFSYLSAHGAAATMKALGLGAADFALKPNADGAGLSDATVWTELEPLIRALVAGPGQSPTRPTARRDTTSVPAALVVAASTGGPNALGELLPRLPADLPVPVLVVQHMPPVFTRTMAERLDSQCALSVVEAAEGEPVAAGRVYIAPGGRHMAIARTGAGVVIALNDDPPEQSCRPAADVLFTSAAQVYGPGTMSLVMTGMGRDGLRGSVAIASAGGIVLAQSPQTCVVGSMPSAVIRGGLADDVLDLDELPGAITDRLALGAGRR